MNVFEMMRVANLWKRFAALHPKLPAFMTALQQSGALKPGTVLELSVDTEDGKRYCSNIRLSQADFEILAELKAMQGKQK